MNGQIEHVIAMANLNPSGFRTPRTNTGQGPGHPTLVERLTVEAGLADPRDLLPEPSTRALRRRAERRRFRERFREQKAQGLELRANRRGMK
jgi:hypothetical protein